MSLTHETCMQRCLDLARNGLGSAAPNPLVGAVIVHNGRIIGEGYHTGSGKPHAEVEAVNQVKDQSLLPDSTLYVNLEPCNHQGKTPPCTNLILEKKIGRVVISQTDPNPAAAGGIDRLRNKGVGLITGVLVEESRWLNRRFNTFHEKKRPYLILKWAQTTDGFVDNLRDKPENQKPTWITDETCRRLVHKWRTEEQAILVGSRTILLDNPQLNVRAWTGNNPLRITIDRKGDLRSPHPQSIDFSGDRGLGDRGLGDRGLGDRGLGDRGLGDRGLGDRGLGDRGLGDRGLGDRGLGDRGLGDRGLGDRGLGDRGLGDRGLGDRGSPLRIMDGEIPTIIYTCTEQLNQQNLEFIRISPDEPVWPQVLTDLYNRHIQSVLIEGGPTLIETLIRKDLWDEARVFIGPGWFGNGVKAPYFPSQPKEQGEVGNSRLLQFYREEG